MSYIPGFMTPSLLFLRLERAGMIYDFRMAKGKCGAVALCWFTDVDSATRAVTDEFKTILGTIQITQAESRDVVSEFIANHVADDFSIANVQD
jgi:hypothetical protein